ncbi:hypothetical protein [Bilifractor porci]|uniref:Uncharacterized protein n=1 Tax=Bilifractor porci TaxID=2606636 RepID=A0A7X2TN07_9FIRM|nr:hypothetical protein [Bilifractor porci]MST81789.1 hypothetical protein [Bilifractor porci]
MADAAFSGNTKIWGTDDPCDTMPVARKAAASGTAAGRNAVFPGWKIGSLQKIEKNREKMINNEIKRDNYIFYALA